jgi:hypothetical protein
MLYFGLPATRQGLKAELEARLHYEKRRLFQGKNGYAHRFGRGKEPGSSACLLNRVAWVYDPGIVDFSDLSGWIS